MKKLFTILFLLLPAMWFQATAQTPVPLKYEKDLPKNLFSARTAAQISYTSNQSMTATEEERIFNQLSNQLLADNQQLGLQLVHVANHNALANPTQKQQLLHQYDSLKIENMLTLTVTDIKMAGAQSSYVLLLTAYNGTPKMMSPRQRAFTLQAESYESLIRSFSDYINQYSKGYFNKGPGRDPAKVNLPAEPEPAPASATLPTDVKPNVFPPVTLTIEDQDRRFGGAHRNFYYYVGADQQEKNAGFFGQHLREDIGASPLAVQELNKYRLYKIAYLAERLVFVTAVSLYGLEVIRGNDYSYFNDRQKLYLGLAGGSLLVNILVSRQTNQHLFQAIDEYNTFAASRNQTGFRQFKPDGLGFGTVYDRGFVPGITLNWQLR